MLPDYVCGWLCDKETEQFTFVTEAALRVFGYSREEFLSMKPSDLVIPQELPRIDVVRAVAPKQWGAGQFWVCRRADGTQIKIQIRYHIALIDNRETYVALLNFSSPRVPELPETASAVA
jgi:PAS domain S-box-containing protein